MKGNFAIVRLQLLALVKISKARQTTLEEKNGHTGECRVSEEGVGGGGGGREQTEGRKFSSCP